MEPRYSFIPELRDRLVGSLAKQSGAAPDIVRASVERWEAGEDPQSVLDAGVFATCETVKLDIINHATEKEAQS